MNGLEASWIAYGMLSLCVGAITGILWICCWTAVSKNRSKPVPTCTDHRNEARTNNSSSVQSFIQSPVGKLTDCWVVNWSNGGVGVFLSSYVGTQLHRGLHLAIKSSKHFTGPWVDVEITNVRRDIYGWYVGCRFTKPVPPDILHTFK